MAIKATAEQDVLDITDGYSIHLSNDNYTFQGTTTSVEGTQSLTCKITAITRTNINDNCNKRIN